MGLHKMITFNEGSSEETGGKVILVKCSIVNICLHFILFPPKSSKTLDMLTTLKKKILFSRTTRTFGHKSGGRIHQ